MANISTLTVGGTQYNIKDTTARNTFANYLPLAGGTLTGNITFNKVNNAIAYSGSKAAYNMIKFIDNTGDNYGNGISIGGCGLTIIGGGESNDTVAAQYTNQGGTETLLLCSDQTVDILTNCQSGYDSRKTFTFNASGDLTVPRYLYANYLNASCSAETPTTSSYIMYANSDGFLRKSSLANIKNILGLGSNAYNSTSYLPTTGGTLTGNILVEHASGGSNEVQVKYGSTVDFAMMIGTGNENHGIYDNKAGKWMMYADGSGNVTLNGNAATATSAGSATKATQDESGNNIKASYAASFSISDHTITLKNKNGVSLGTVTVPDNNTTYNFSGTAFTSNNSTGVSANDVTYNAHTYYTSNGPATSLGATTNDGALYTQAYSTSWVAQIAQDYRNGALFVRGKNNGTWQSWQKVYDTAHKPTYSDVGAAAASHGHGVNTTNVGSASGWSAGSVPTVTAVACDDITSWSAGTVTTVTVPSGTTKLVITNGTAPSLGYTARSVNSVTNVGTAPALTVSTVTVATSVKNS